MRYTQLIAKMSLAEKCALLTGKDIWHTRAIERIGVPAMSMADGPSGLRKQAGSSDHLGLNESTKATCIPSASTLANSWDPVLAEQMGTLIGAEAQAQDVQVLLGPGLNTKRNPLCGRNFEYYSEDPYLSGKMAAGFIRGVQSRGVSACAKHFAANNQETVRMHSDSIVDERALHELYLSNFEIAVREGKPQSIMSSYNRVNGIYANESEHLLQDILRNAWGFDGAVITDWGGSNNVVEGVQAGMNLEMPGCGDDSAVQLINAVKTGNLSESVLDQRVDELLYLIFISNENKAKKQSASDMEAHHALAGKAAEESLVLLKNNEQLLPLSNTVRVAVIGDFAQKPRYQGAGSSMVNPYRIDTILNLLAEYLPASVGYSQGYQRRDKADEPLAEQAVTLAKNAECVLLFMGLTEAFEAEGLDRTHMRLPQNQISLLKRLAGVNENIVVVLSTGSAVEAPWVEYCQALLLAGLGGQAGAQAILRAITGQAVPSGKLSETWPIALEDMPSSQYFPGKQATAEYRESLYIGYRATETGNIPVQFPFGFGLSYTTFSYQSLDITDNTIVFQITNTGPLAGYEVAQLYVSLPDAKVFRPAKELKGFTKVFLKPGESKRVSISLDDKALRYFNVLTNQFEIEGGTYLLQIGASVQDIRLSGQLTVPGTNAPNPYQELPVSCYQTGNLIPVPDESFAAVLGHSIPEKSWDMLSPLGMNDTISQLFYAKSLAARLMCHFIKARSNACIAAGKPNLNLLYIYNMPFRGIAKMMNGMVTMRMAKGLLLMANGHFFRGFGILIDGLFHKPNL